MRLYEYSLVFGYVVAIDAHSVVIFAPKYNDVVARLLSYWIMRCPCKIVYYLPDIKHLKNWISDANEVCHAIALVNVNCF